MPRRKVTQLRKFCALIAGHSWQHAERVSQAVIELVREWLPEELDSIDVEHLLMSLGEKLDHDRERLTEIDNQHAHELQIDRNLREARDAAAAAVRERLLQLRDSLDGLFGRGGSAKIFEDETRIPADPVALHQLTGHVRGNLGNEAFPMPEPLQRGFKLDRKEAVKDLDEPFQRLTGALKALATTESESKHSQSLKEQEVDEVDVFTGKAVRFLEALLDLVGLDALSDRLRRSSHRAASSDDESDEPDPGDAGNQEADTGPEAPSATPAAGAPAAGVPATEGG